MSIFYSKKLHFYLESIWYEKGEVGWWCSVSDEKPQEEWDVEVKALLKDIPGDTLLTVFDCHI